MTKRLLGIGTAVVAVVVTSGIAMAQRADEPQGAAGPRWQTAQGQPQTPPAGPPARQGVGQPGARGQGQGWGPGPGQGPGRGRAFGQGQFGGRGGAWGPGPGAGRGMGRGRGLDARAGFGAGFGQGGRLDALLDLTDDQQKAIDTLRRATRDQAAAVTDELELTRKALHRELFADKRDAAKVTSLAAKVATLEKQMLDLHLKTQASVSDVLTPAQRETMRIRR